MSDKELLELAAKAAGIEGYFEYFMCQEEGDGGSVVWCCFINGKEWNPLDINTGDALRLAVKLGIGISNYSFDGKYFVKCGSWRSTIAFTEPLNENPCTATCRAIVRAAAEIGRGME